MNNQPINFYDDIKKDINKAFNKNHEDFVINIYHYTENENNVETDNLKFIIENYEKGKDISDIDLSKTYNIVKTILKKYHMTNEINKIGIFYIEDNFDVYRLAIDKTSVKHYTSQKFSYETDITFKIREQLIKTSTKNILDYKNDNTLKRFKELEKSNNSKTQKGKMNV